MSAIASIFTRGTLLSLLVSRIVAVAMLAITLQIVEIFLSYYSDEPALAKYYVESEAKALASGITVHAGKLHFELPATTAYYAAGQRDAYAFRITDTAGSVIATANPSLLAPLSPWVTGSEAQSDRWFRRLDPQWLHIAGGERVQVGPHSVRIEVATSGDPAHAYRRVIRDELVEHIVMPLTPFLVLVVIVTMVTVRGTLRPVALAAQAAEAMDPRRPRARLRSDGMPREIASFVAAVNRALHRVQELAASQKVFLATAAHELRTPLAVMLLELGKIQDPRARRLEGDVRGMSNLVMQLLDLSRLELVEPPRRSAIDLEDVVRDAVARLAPWVLEQGDRIEFEVDRPGSMQGDVPSIADAIRNLVENAVRHSPAGTTIIVRVGPDCRVSVEDSGPGMPPTEVDRLVEPFQKGSASADGLGLGLAIVKRIVELHEGRLSVGRSVLGGARFDVDFAPSGAAFRSA